MKKIRLVFLLFLSALALRLMGVDWGMPYRLHPDAGKYIKPAAYDFGAGDFNPHYFENPSGFTYPLWLWLEAVDWIETLRGTVEPRATLRERYEYEPWLVELWGRWLVVILGALTVWVMYGLAIRILSERGALLATLLVAVCFVHVRQSRFAVNDVPMLLVFMGGMYFTLLYWERCRRRDLLLAALLAGYATGTKYTAFVAVPAILPALVWPRESQTEEKPSPRWILSLCAIGVVSGVGFILACPYSILDYREFMDELQGLAGGRIKRWEGQGETPVVFLVIHSLIYGVGLGPFLLVLAALWYERKTLRLPWRRLAPFWGGPLTLVLLMSQPMYFPRFGLPLLPYLALLVGWAGDYFLQHYRSTSVAVLVVLMVGIESLTLSLRQGILCMRTDTRVLAVEYFQQQIRPNETIAADDMALPLRYREVKIPPAEIPYVDLGLDLSQVDPAWLVVNGFQWLAVSGFASHLFEQAHPEQTSLWLQRLNAVGDSVHVIRAGSNIPFHLEHATTPFVGLFTTERPGPDIYIFRLHADKARALLPPQ